MPCTAPSFRVTPNARFRALSRSAIRKSCSMAEPARQNDRRSVLRLRRRNRSRSSRASTPCASGRACISATPTTAPACTTWSTRSSTTPSTRRSPATPPRSTVTLNPDGSVHGARRRPRHPDRHPQGRRRLGGRGHHDPAACRRKIRPELLQGVRRPARRRRLGRQRAVDAGSSSRSGATARNTSWSSATATRSRRSRSSATPNGKRGTEVTFLPSTQDLHHDRVRFRDAGAPAARARLPQFRRHRSCCPTCAMRSRSARRCATRAASRRSCNISTATRPRSCPRRS